MLKPLKKKTLAEEIIASIRDLVISGELKPGDKLPGERELAEQLCVSRASVREALRALSLAGIIVVKPGDGTYLNDDISRMFGGVFNSKLLFIVERNDALQLAEARKILEIELARLAAMRATIDNLKDIEHTLKAMEKHIGEPDYFIKQDVAFHVAVSEAAQNNILFEAINAIRDLMTEVQREIVVYPGLMEKSFGYHKRIYQAIKEGNTEEAAKAMSEHLAHVEAVTRELFPLEE
ncbi:MAG: FadR/GntR family transcriptional regulator [Thermoanaerobacteraceae bacterium]|nr:FadR/GntR family transcriptional regulator [Thermoanaerobacteraceae bacterium]